MFEPRKEPKRKHIRVFDDIISRGILSGQLPARTTEAREWYRDAAKSYSRRVNESQFLKADKRLTNMIRPGHMYMYYYDPKYKEELPFYDKFPLVFPFRVEHDRFWAINLHYLPLPLRAKLMDALYELSNNKRYDESTKLKLSYQILKSASKYKYFKPCVKQYLFSQLKSKFVYVFPYEWDIAIFLPTERFTKANKTQVHRNSKELLR